MMNNLLPKIVLVFMLAMAANLCFSNPLYSKLDADEIVSSSEENFTRMANISHLDLHGSNLTESANSTSLPNNGSVLVREKNGDRGPVKKPNYAVYIDGIMRQRFFEHLFVFAIFFFMLVFIMVYVDDNNLKSIWNNLVAWKRSLGRKRNRNRNGTTERNIKCGENSQAKPSETVTV